jgi:hypothetical protein
MGGPAYYTGVMNIAQNEDWVVPFIYGTPSSDGTSVIPIDLTGSTLMLEIREQESDHEAVVSVSSPGSGIALIDAVNGAFTITMTRDKLARLWPGTFVTDLVRVMPNGLVERMWEGTATVVEGTTR